MGHLKPINTSNYFPNRKTMPSNFQNQFCNTSQPYFEVNKSTEKFWVGSKEFVSSWLQNSLLLKNWTRLSTVGFIFTRLTFCCDLWLPSLHPKEERTSFSCQSFCCFLSRRRQSAVVNFFFSSLCFCSAGRKPYLTEMRSSSPTRQSATGIGWTWSWTGWRTCCPSATTSAPAWTSCPSFGSAWATCGPRATLAVRPDFPQSSQLIQTEQRWFLLMHGYKLNGGSIKTQAGNSHYFCCVCVNWKKNCLRGQKIMVQRIRNENSSCLLELI